MVEKDQISKEKMGHSGIFDFSALYSFMHDWFKDELYGVIEERYAEKVTEKGRTVNFEWKATKLVTDYFKFELAIKMEIKDLIDVEVEIDGKKKKMNKGGVDMEVKATILKDPESKWDTTPVLRFLREVYNKYIIRARIDALEEKIKSDAVTFKDEVKAFLDLTGKRKSA